MKDLTIAAHRGDSYHFYENTMTSFKAAVAAGANGLIIEVHNDPKKALCDGPQSLTVEEFRALMNKVGKIAEIEGKTI